MVQTVANGNIAVGNSIQSPDTYSVTRIELETGGYALAYSTQANHFFVQTYDASGEATSNQIQVAAAGYAFTITPLIGGGFATAWAPFGAGSSNPVMTQIFDDQGSPINSPIASGYSTFGIGGISLTPLITGEFILSWAQSNSPLGAYSIFAKTISHSGTELTSGILINGNAATPAGRILQDDGTLLFSYYDRTIKFASYNPAGSVSTSTGFADIASSLNAYSQITRLASGNILVTWHDIATSSTIRGKIFSATGTDLGQSFSIGDSSASFIAPTITALANGGFAIAYLKSQISANSSKLFAKMFAADGTAIGSEFAVGNGVNNYERSPLISENGDSGFTISWLDGTNSSNTTRFSRDYYIAVTGTSGDDVMNGDDITSYLVGLAGNDALNGNGGDDLLWGGAGADILNGGDGSDTAIYEDSPAGITIDLIAGTGLGGDAEGDTLISIENVIGSAFADLFVASSAANRFEGGAGSDTVDYSASPIRVTVNLATGIGVGGYAQGDSYFGIENIRGSEFADVITGDAEANRLEGLGGNDNLLGSAGADVMDGGDGFDAVNYAASASAVIVNLATGTGRGGDAEGDTYISIEGAVGSAFNDTLIGGAGDNILRGFTGDDILTGGLGMDTLDGGPGNDIFRDTAAGLDGDTISDFAAGDRINITDAVRSGFAFSVNGNTLTYSGGSLTLTVVPAGRLIATASASSGVDIMVENIPVRHARDDFNGDGISDVLWRSNGGQTSNWLGKANGGFTGNDTNAFSSVPTSWQIAGTGDFNGDGRADVLWRSTSGQMSDWLGTASGGFTNNDANAFATVATNWKIAGTGDFNGDGRDDILWRSDSGQLSNWLGTANGGFTGNDANAFSSAPTSWHIAGTGDFNGDGRDDILWRSDSGQLSNWLGTASGGFTNNDTNAYTTVGTDWNIVGTGDFNGDGRTDILWRSDSGQLSNWLGTASGGFTSNDANAFTTVPTSWQVAAVGDYNGDGRDDILWRNADGAMSNWLGTGSGGFTPNDTNAYTTVGTDWTIQATAHIFV